MLLFNIHFGEGGCMHVLVAQGPDQGCTVQVLCVCMCLVGCRLAACLEATPVQPVAAWQQQQQAAAAPAPPVPARQAPLPPAAGAATAEPPSVLQQLYQGSNGSSWLSGGPQVGGGSLIDLGVRPGASVLCCALPSRSDSGQVPWLVFRRAVSLTGFGGVLCLMLPPACRPRSIVVIVPAVRLGHSRASLHS